MTTSSKYPFYVSLDSQDGLILGQHVYIETNVDGTADENAAQFSLPSYYIVDLDTDSPYVWAEGSNGKLEKRKVELGDYDQDMDQYPVISGLSLTDYIAFPSEDCQAGATAEHYDAASGEEDTGEGMMTDDGEMMENMPADGGEMMDSYDEGTAEEDMGAYEEDMTETGEDGTGDVADMESAVGEAAE